MQTNILLRIRTSLVALLMLPVAVLSQTPTFPINGAPDLRSTTYKLEGGTVIVRPGVRVNNATLFVRDGKIVDAPPAGGNVVVKNVKGKFIYPAFIDLDSDYGLAKESSDGQRGRRFSQPVMSPERAGAYGNNDALKADYKAYHHFSGNADKAAALRSMGFGAVLSHRHDGIARGTSVLVSTADGQDNTLIIKEEAAAHLSFQKGTSRQDYPGSLMGSIALLRQTYLDMEWYKEGGFNVEKNITLEAMLANARLPQIFEVNDKYAVLRADKVGDEVGVQYIFRGAGDEYQRAADIKKAGGSLIVPLSFPDAYDVEDPLTAIDISLSLLRHWELAPKNAAILHDNKVPFAFTAKGIDAPRSFFDNLRLAVKGGLPADSALAALTVRPAAFINMSNTLGTLEAGKIANFFIAGDDIFTASAAIEEVWVQGQVHKVSPTPSLADGTYELSTEGNTFRLLVANKGGKAALSVLKDGDTLKADLALVETLISFSFKEKAGNTTHSFSGAISPEGWQGVTLKEGKTTSWKVRPLSLSPAPKERKEEPQPTFGNIAYPMTEFGLPAVATKQERVLFKNATIWTCEEEGTLSNADILIADGKIVRIGKDLSDRAATVIDATGKHISPGIIDEHSHIAITGGVNEYTRAITSEVRIGDVVNPDDINIYRQLAGGVVASQLLHGSANPVGGQSALIKLRWGYTPEAMKIADAPEFIKFALGENVKQSNWGDFNTVRFPQTRMGVEQVFRDGFSRAERYDRQRRSRPAAKPEVPLRRDLTLEALAEIVNSRRFISCHSYVQSEITMLMRVAEDFGFKVNTFTHILEGYKVADKMKEHGVGGSSFSDWWAYKFEVIDAIPYNGAILQQMGVVTAFNSDDAEMGRRLNQEAAKAVKYGKITEEEALKFVTLNPAKLLRLDDRMGSLKAGKDADIVLWSDNPLSIYAKAEMTFVDGIRFFDIERDSAQHAADLKERERLLTAMRQAKKDGKRTSTPPTPPDEEYNCGSKHVFGNK